MYIGTRCPALVNPANGMVMLTADRPEDNATYTCDAGFVLVGDAMLTCQDDGMWSDVPPTCQGITSDTGNFCGMYNYTLEVF